ncbi:MAG TPA: hypothetical protein VEU62_01730, partial [Bryobacterales bacterium]|nr:hypothetical protein [Bryobacterales bacterium]
MQSFLLLSFLLAAALLLRSVEAAGARRIPAKENERRVVLGEADPGSLYAVTVSVKDPAQWPGRQSVHAAIADARGAVAEKWLHAADLDFYLTLHPRARGQASVTLSAAKGEAIPEMTFAFHRIPAGREEPAVIAAAPNDTWQTAQPVEFGQTIFGGADERPYAPAPNEDRYAAML